MASAEAVRNRQSVGDQQVLLSSHALLPPPFLFPVRCSSWPFRPAAVVACTPPAGEEFWKEDGSKGCMEKATSTIYT